jgi:hypothetical protein
MSIFKKQNQQDHKGYIIRCNCESSGHQISIGWFLPNDLDNCKEVYFSYSLYPFVFWKRVWYALKYVFGYRSRLGDYGELTLFPEDIDSVINILKEAKEDLL